MRAVSVIALELPGDLLQHRRSLREWVDAQVVSQGRRMKP